MRGPSGGQGTSDLSRFATTRPILGRVSKRSVISGVTLVVLVGLLVTGAYVGWQKLKEPIPGGDDGAHSQVSGPRCKEGVKRGDLVRPRDVTVSVYNAGSRTGLAGQTMSELEARG